MQWTRAVSQSRRSVARRTASPIASKVIIAMCEASAARPCYLVVFGRCEIEHFPNREALRDAMRAELSSAGISVDDNGSADELDDAYMTFIHDREEGPVQWGDVPRWAAAPAEAATVDSI